MLQRYFDDEAVNILELDSGNSAIKWRFLIQGQRANSGVCKMPLNFDALAKHIAPHQPDRVRMVNVAGDETEVFLVTECKARWRVSVAVASSVAKAAGVHNAYAEPKHLGTDRWLALIAAHAAYPSRALCVIDCGSAITIDFLKKDGQHLGGYIVPGYNTMRQTLVKNTARLKAFSAEYLPADHAPASSTKEAISRGLSLMVSSLLESCAQSFSSDALLVFTGGDASIALASLNKALLGRACHHTELVLDGLKYTLP